MQPGLWAKIKRRLLPGVGINPFRTEAPNKATVEVLLRGGLGNQLFGYAAGLEISLRTGAPLHLVTQMLGARIGTVRSFELAPLMSPTASHGPTSSAPSIFREASFAYDARIEGVGAGRILDGYFQSSKYFSDAVALMRQECLKTDAFIQRSPEIAPGGFIAVHVRRGDYALPSNRRVHGLLPISYFKNGLSKLRAELGPLEARVFSDDTDYGCLVADQLDAATPVVDHPSKTSFEALAELSSARGLCISNSSFGWWAAFLSDVGTPIVIPDPWFAQPDIDTSDLAEKGWQTIPVAYV